MAMSSAAGFEADADLELGAAARAMAPEASQAVATMTMVLRCITRASLQQRLDRRVELGHGLLAFQLPAVDHEGGRALDVVLPHGPFDPFAQRRLGLLVRDALA